MKSRRWARRWVTGPASGGASRAAKIASAFLRAGIVLRARAMDRLLAAVGPLALATIAGGAFARHVATAIPVTLEDAARATWRQIYELVRYVEQADPARLANVWGILADREGLAATPA